MRFRPHLVVVMTSIVCGQSSGQHPASCQVFKQCASAPGVQWLDVGSAALVHAEYVVTNEHVAGSSGAVVVRWPNGRRVPGTVVGADAPNDVAVIKLERPVLDVKPFRVVAKWPAVGSIGYQDGRPGDGPWRTRRARVTNLSHRWSGGTVNLVTWANGSLEGESGGPFYGPGDRLYALCATTDGYVSSGPSGHTVRRLLGCLLPRCFDPLPPPQFSPPVPIPISPPDPGGGPLPQDLPNDFAGVPAPGTESPEVYLDGLAAKIVDRMAADGRFRGPSGPEGKPGPPGPPADLSSVEERLDALEAEFEALRALIGDEKSQPSQDLKK